MKCLHRLFTKFDCIILAAVVVLFAASFAPYFMKAGGKYAQISVDGKVLYSLPLAQNCQQTVATEYGENTVVICDGQCYVSLADCRDEICIKRGKISKAGESIVCLPHRLIVEVVQDEK